MGLCSRYRGSGGESRIGPRLAPWKDAMIRNCRTCKKPLERDVSVFSIPARPGKPERVFCSAKCVASHLTARFTKEIGEAK